MRRLLRAKYIMTRAVPGAVTTEEKARPPLRRRNRPSLDVVQGGRRWEPPEARWAVERAETQANGLDAAWRAGKWAKAGQPSAQQNGQPGRLQPEL